MWYARRNRHIYMGSVKMPRKMWKSTYTTSRNISAHPYCRHIDITIVKRFPRYRLFVRESIGHRWIPLTKACDAVLWCFPLSTPEQAIGQKIETPVIWDASRSLWRHTNVSRWKAASRITLSRTGKETLSPLIKACILCTVEQSLG